MESLKNAITTHLFLVVFFAIFLVILVLATFFFSRKDKKRSIYFYGLFMNMNLKEKLTLTGILINFIFLTYVLVMKVPLTLIIGIISQIIIALAFVILGKYKDLLFNIIINFINIGLIILANLVNTLRLEFPGVSFYILQICMNVFGILFYIFTSLKFIRDIRKGVGKGERKV